MNLSYTLQIAVPLLYLAAAVAIGYGLHLDRAALKRGGVVVAIIGVLLHAYAFWIEFSMLGGPSADFFSALSLVSLLILLVLMIGMLRYPVLEILPLALPGAAFMVLHKLIISPDPMALETGSFMLDVHVTASLLSYSLLSIAAVTALFIAVLHNLLRRHKGAALIEILPPLVVMENMLFKMILAGWLILSLSLATGLIFVDNLFAQHLAHKTFLSITSWLVFGLLLAGRWRYGWRGMRVVRLCLIGMAILLLAYFGSKAVLELMLDRRWQAG
ncbi:MAG TPA: cytochrome c biogenesis protein CcsA [Wenzhouxiangellaceae bacterium]|nr:cytochrome c biogenesis protein CcsA [Wenzhouxiangellaceae bacterium]